MTLRSWIDFPKGALIGTLLSALVFASIWFPEISHWYVSPAPTSSQVLEAARHFPEQSVLEEVATMPLGAIKVAAAQVLSAADEVMRGTLSLPSFTPVEITLPFAPEDLIRGLPTFQLAVASLVSADILLDAYRMTQREEFFLQARDIIVAFAKFEGAQWINSGLMWNDHATSARIPVLIKFWASYRTRSDFDPRVGRIVLDLVTRSAQLLSKPSFYAWRTSHGTLTDLALLQIAAAFPTLQGIAEIRRIAEERFRNHLSYWINEEGVTLLHSAGYHGGSLYHFGLALRLFTLNGMAIPDDWWKRYGRAVDFYSLLRRPDGTLPMYGDTSSMPSEMRPRLTQRRDRDGGAEPLTERMLAPTPDAVAVYPVAGHAIWWDGLTPTDRVDARPAQTVVTWSYHPGLGHKVADELSIILWANSRTWLTNTGYWPYGVWGREQAESWEASNAPHLYGESKNSDRTSRVRGVGQGKGISFIDVERSGPDGYAARRQIVRLDGAQSWVVLDHSRDSAARTTTTTWTFYPDLLVNPLGTQDRYAVIAPNSTVAMLCSFSSSEAFTTKMTAGKETPFAGWVVLDRTPTHAPAVIVRQPSRDGWSLASFTLTNAAHAATINYGVRMDKWIDAEHWALVLLTASGEVTLTRAGGRLAVDHPSPRGTAAVIDLTAREGSEAEFGTLRNAIRAASETYRTFPELIFYRIKVSYLLVAVLAGQELLLFSMRRRLARTTRRLRVASWICWLIGGLWLTLAYFTVPP